jgi:2-dehydro-3-deoxygluconokinase
MTQPSFSDNSNQKDPLHPSSLIPHPSYDVVTLGETMIRLTPPGFKRIEQAISFDIEIGGSESNTAVGLARLGMRVAWLSRLTANPLGRLLAQTLAGYGVDTSWIIWTDQDRIGLYFLEEGKAPRGSSVTYDRANSAMSRMQPADLPAELFQAGKSRLLHLTGITPALGPQAAATARQALELAQAAGWLFSFDLNYRSKLWTTEQAVEGCDFFARAANLLIAPTGDARLIYNLSASTPSEKVLETLAKRYPQATVVLTLGKEGALGREPGGPMIHQPVFPAEEVGRIGGGDAFAAGLLYGYLQAETGEGQDRLARALRWGAAVAALKYSTPGDMPIINRQEAARLVSEDISGPSITR